MKQNNKYRDPLVLPPEVSSAIFLITLLRRTASRCRYSAEKRRLSYCGLIFMLYIA